MANGGKPSSTRKAGRPFAAKVAGGMEGEMGLADKAPAGATYPAGLDDNAPGTEYAGSANAQPNPKDRAAG